MTLEFNDLSKKQLNLELLSALCSYADSFEQCGKILHACTTLLSSECATFFILKVLSDKKILYELKGGFC